MGKITPFLWFNDDAEQAAEFYLSVFPSGRKLNELRVPGGGPGPAGSLLAVDLELEGQEMTFLNGGPSQALTEAFSFVVRCETQVEIDGYWARLLEGGGKEIACGWLKDRFGLAWQIVPREMFKLVQKPAQMKAMMGMVKLDIAALERAGAE